MTIADSKTDPETVEEEGLLTRWSRRKHEARTPQPEQQDAQEIQAGAVDEVQAKDEPDEYLPDDSDMPALETLDEDADYSGFMSPKVSDALRTLALRQMFRGSSFNIRDGLDDYDDDFTQFTKLGDVVTAEMRRQIARLKEAGEADPDGNSVKDPGKDSDEGPAEEIAADQSESGRDDEEIIPAELSEAAAAELDDESDGVLDGKVNEKLELAGKEVSGEKTA